MLFEMDRCKKTYTVCLTNPTYKILNERLVFQKDIFLIT